MTHPLLSIIIVTFNAGKTLQIALDSIFQQSFEDFEIVVVDGNSSDDTVDILEKIKDTRLNWISEPDVGIYDAMNKGINRATGQFLYFLGADDQLKNNKVFEKIFEKGTYEDSDFLYGNVYSELLKRNYDGPFDEEKILFSNICHQAIFYKSSVFEKVGLFDTRYLLFADWELNIRCFENLDMVIKYRDILIADYAGEGVSTLNSDLDFLRNFLFVHNVERLNSKGIRALKNIRYYDRWWRLIRRMKLRDDKEISDFINSKGNIPESIKNIILVQRNYPEKKLNSGIFSKSMMMLNYATERLMNNLK
jgi:glycosyltransferase involved in cell wall biosynthesis